MSLSSNIELGVYWSEFLKLDKIVLYGCCQSKVTSAGAEFTSSRLISGVETFFVSEQPVKTETAAAMTNNGIFFFKFTVVAS